MRWRVFATSWPLFFVVGLWFMPSYAQSLPLTPRVGHAVQFGVSPPLRSMKPAPPQPGTGEVREIPRFPRPVPKKAPVGDIDPVVQSSPPLPNMPSPTVTFEGISSDDNNATYGSRPLPPDTNGDVGPNHYVQAVNLLFQVFDKTTGTPLTLSLIHI